MDIFTSTENRVSCFKVEISETVKWFLYFQIFKKVIKKYNHDRIQPRKRNI